MVLSDYAMYSRSDYNSARSVYPNGVRVAPPKLDRVNIVLDCSDEEEDGDDGDGGSETEDEVEQPHKSSDGWMTTFIPQKRIAGITWTKIKTEWGEYFLPHDTRLMIPGYVIKEGPQGFGHYLGGDLHGANYVRASAIEEVD